MSAEEVYKLVSPSILFIETDASTGSGILVEGGYVVTNHHVVWPYESAWVVFPDGTELQDVPVVGWDPMTDLAVLGPVIVPALPLKLVDGEDMSIGSELFLVGYPAEVDVFPEPSITRGILSRFREWDSLGMTYLQTDATIAGGQSGGALLNSNGSVVGISGLRFSEVGFGLAASSADVAPIVEELKQGEFTSEVGDRRLPVGRGGSQVKVDLHNYWDARTFVLHATAGTVLRVEMEGSGDGWFHVSDPFGPLLEVNDSFAGIEHGEVELQYGGIYFLQAEMASGDSGNFDLTSSVSLRPVNDPDDGRTIRVGETVAGSLDYFYDWDWYSIHLDEGETVRIRTDSLLVDTIVYVDFPNSRINQVVSDDDSGGGLFGTNSELVYRAPMTGEYLIAVSEAAGDVYAGGYYLSVEPARRGTETVYVPAGPDVVESPFGGMLVFEDPSERFRIEVPQAWTELETDPSAAEVFSGIDPGGNATLLVVMEVVSDLGIGAPTLTGYADVIESTVLIPNGATEIERESVQTSQGLPAIRFEMLLFDERATQLIYVSDDGVAFSTTYSFPAEWQDTMGPLVDYSFGTLTDMSYPIAAAVTAATPRPTEVPASAQTYLNDKYGYRIDIASGWAVGEEADDYVSFWSDDENAWLEVITWDLGTSYSLVDFAEEARASLEETALDENWNLLEVTSWGPRSEDGREFYELGYLLHRSEESCVEHVSEVLELSSSYPAEPYGFIVSAGTCAYSLNLHGQEIKAMLGSFRP